ncbi:MAG: RecX family transcriptional regulator [Eudoraea sp.]|nr:RecX family transcriptional regulator [Eudoraea sp.]
MKEVSENNVYKEALSKLEHYCAYQERCTIEIQQKLKDYDLSADDKKNLISHLIDSDLLNENRFALQYSRGKFRIKEWGKFRIQRQLRSKRISEETIQHALDQLDPNEYIEVFNALAIRKLEGIKTDHSLRKRKKLADLLLYRGWESELVYDKVRELIP